MEQKDTYLIYLKKKVRTKTLEASIMILIEAGLFVLTWYKLGWQIVIQTFPIWFLFALVHLLQPVRDFCLLETIQRTFSQKVCKLISYTVIIY